MRFVEITLGGQPRKAAALTFGQLLDAVDAARAGDLRAGLEADAAAVREALASAGADDADAVVRGAYLDEVRGAAKTLVEHALGALGEPTPSGPPSP
jgi:hypothetical protein